ncbi:uncharacterized protein TORIP isoform X2 [Bactrocera oleae]|nr:uncharacterized protein LOC106617965 isoform X1 [Bactrocera oleae]XP_014090935.1 uncharacterized protein LOC106617965 isoform X1 [Bactrocera oleae]
MYTNEEHSNSSELVNTSNELLLQKLDRPESYKLHDRKSKAMEKQSSNNKCITASLIIVILLVVAMWYLYASDRSEKGCSFETLRQKYKDQHSKMWPILSSGVENILRGHTKNSGVYLFLHNDSSEFKSIVGEIATQTSRCFGGQLIEMSENDFTSPKVMEDYGHAITKFKEKIRNGRVALIVNLNTIPAGSARALQFICDTHNPVAKDIVIYLTLVIPSTIGNEVNIARDTLTKLWGSKLEDYELEPIITRVTDQVIPLN